MGRVSDHGGVMYGDPTPQGMAEWERRLEQARRRRDTWRNVRDLILVLAMAASAASLIFIVPL